MKQIPTEIRVPGVMLQCWGLHAEKHIKAHKAKLSKYQFDVGLDLFPCFPPYEEVVMNDDMIRLNIPTGINIFIPPGCFGMILDRSSTPIKLHGATTYGGIIDPTYTGELKVHLHFAASKRADVLASLEASARSDIAIAQIVFLPYLVPVMELSSKVVFSGGRGDAGYGSTDGKIQVFNPSNQ